MTSAPPVAWRSIAGAALTCIALAVTACDGSSSPSAAPTKTVSATAPSSAPAGTGGTGPTSAAPATSPAAPGGPGPCPTRSLQAKLGHSQGAAGSTYTVIDFTNLSSVTCTLYGYPGVSLAGGKPVTQIGLAAAESKATARRLVTLAPGAVANALLQMAHAQNYPASRCNPVMATYLQIYPPNQTTPIYLSYPVQTCAKPVQLLTVSVVQPGSGGSA